METLNLSDSTPHSESRLKSLLWPSIQNGADVDYLRTQGWVCTLLAIVSFILSLVSGEPVGGAVMLLFYYLGGVGGGNAAAMPQPPFCLPTSVTSDQFPSWLWPKIRAAYYVFSVCGVVLFATGITMLIRRSTH